MSPCSCKTKKRSYAAFFHYIGRRWYAVYALIKPLKACRVPYWCKPFSAYNDSPPVGYMQLTDAMSGVAIPIEAKYSVKLLASDIHGGSVKPLEYYGTILCIGRRYIRYDPALMQGTAYMLPKATFLAKVAAAAAATPSTCENISTTHKTTTPGGNSAAGTPAPAKAAGGLALTLYGLASIISA